jgi:transcriptional regulator with XRE-family HTH domain
MVARAVNDGSRIMMFYDGMSDVTRIHRDKQPRRPHFIPQWAEKRGLRQSDIVEQIGVDKGTVSKWFSGATPGTTWQQKLAALFECEPESLFRDPDDDWIGRFLKQRSQDERARIRQVLEVMFPEKKANGER